MLRKYFTFQLENHPIITTDVYSKVEYRRVWSGNMIELGDRVLYAYVRTADMKTLQLMCILERELNQMDTIFMIDGNPEDTIPVLKFINEDKDYKI